MANITKMFIHYDHTVADFKAAGLESTYANSIVFISGAGSETPALGYTITYAVGNTLLILWGVILTLMVG